MPSAQIDSKATSLNCSNIQSYSGPLVNFVFHGLFGFVISEDKSTITVAAPVVTDHVAAVRLSIPKTATPGDVVASPAPFFIPQNKLSVKLKNKDVLSRTRATIDSRNIVRIKRRKPGAGTVWHVPQPTDPHVYVSFNLPYPNCISAYRVTSNRIQAGFCGTDVSPEDKDPGEGKHYAIVHRFAYQANPASLTVDLNYSFGTVNLMKGLSSNQVTVHFYAQELYPQDHTNDALASLKKMFPQSPSVVETRNLIPPVKPAKAEGGLTDQDERDLGDLLLVKDPARIPMGAKLRNCISIYFDNSESQS